MDSGHVETSRNLSRARSYDLFGDVTFHPTTRWELTAGVRYSRDDKTTSWASSVAGRSVLGGIIGAAGIAKPGTPGWHRHRPGADPGPRSVRPQPRTARCPCSASMPSRPRTMAISAASRSAIQARPGASPPATSSLPRPISTVAMPAAAGRRCCPRVPARRTRRRAHLHHVPGGDGRRVRDRPEDRFPAPAGPFRRLDLFLQLQELPDDLAGRLGLRHHQCRQGPFLRR